MGGIPRNPRYPRSPRYQDPAVAGVQVGGAPPSEQRRVLPGIGLRQHALTVGGSKRTFCLDASPTIREKGLAMSVELSVYWHLESPFGKDALGFNGPSGSRIQALR
jgi:hypothetical protein